MSPAAFVRRPQRWIQALSDGSRTGRVVTAAPNFAYEYTAQRGVPSPGDDAVSARHGLVPADVRLVPAGSIPRTTSGKLARLACRDEYVRGELR